MLWLETCSDHNSLVKTLKKINEAVANNRMFLKKHNENLSCKNKVLYSVYDS